MTIHGSLFVRFVESMVIMMIVLCEAIAENSRQRHIIAKMRMIIECGMEITSVETVWK